MKKKVTLTFFKCKKCHLECGLNPLKPLFEKCPYCGGDFEEETEIKSKEIEIPDKDEKLKKGDNEHSVVNLEANQCWCVYCPLCGYVGGVFRYYPSICGTRNCLQCGDYGWESGGTLQCTATVCGGWS